MFWRRDRPRRAGRGRISQVSAGEQTNCRTWEDEMGEENCKPRDREPMNMCARERAAQVLRNRARRYHEEAVRLDALADWATNLDAPQDEALWNILQGFNPR